MTGAGAPVQAVATQGLWTDPRTVAPLHQADRSRPRTPVSGAVKPPIMTGISTSKGARCLPGPLFIECMARHGDTVNTVSRFR